MMKENVAKIGDLGSATTIKETPEKKEEPMKKAQSTPNPQKSDIVAGAENAEDKELMLNK
jgi:hypothetical protein